MPPRKLVERGENGGRGKADGGKRSHGAPELSHRRRSRDPPADDVTYHEPEGLILHEPEGVIPVATNLCTPDRRDVGDLELESGRHREFAGEQASLQLLRDLVLSLTGPQQFMLITPSVGGVENRCSDDTGPLTAPTRAARSA
jgi:hypothetical protein